MNSIFDKIYNTILKHNMLSDGDNVLVGVSGGADSVFMTLALFHLKSKLKISLGIAHVNHGIRGCDADQDQKFVENLCKDLSLPFHTVTLDIPNIAKKQKISEETAGRNERYLFFNDICKKYGYNKIAVAHNMNDSVETVIINLIRGSALKGLCGIQPINANIIRPIIEISRDEIENYLRSNNVDYCTDITNSSDIYTRNKIRNKIIPLMQEINPAVVHTIFSNLDNLNEDYHFIEKYTDSTNCISTRTNDVIINKTEFNKLDSAIKKRVILHVFKMIHGNCNNIEGRHIDILTKEVASGKVLKMPNDIIVESCFDELIFTKNTNSTNNGFNYVVPLCETDIENEYFSCKIDIIDNIDFVDNYCIENTLYIDADKLNTKNSIYIRNRFDGDKIKLLGLKGSKKIKQLMSELHIQASRRNQIPLLCADDEVIAVIPYRISEDYKVTEKTKKILRIRMLKEN